MQIKYTNMKRGLLTLIKPFYTRVRLPLPYVVSGTSCHRYMSTVISPTAMAADVHSLPLEPKALHITRYKFLQCGLPCVQSVSTVDGDVSVCCCDPNVPIWTLFTGTNVTPDP